ncbi:glycosyltransferase family 1 protein [Collybiopsis luxurians FD-317 M1]|nr:glycosyltransferase family 1 protein [Collybiopsis luxurians FD-317 M1]
MTRRILLTTNCEYGQANVVLALAFELATRPDVKVAIASFSPLEKRVAHLQNQLRDMGFDSADVSFHALPGRGHIEAVGMTRLDTPHGPGVSEALHSFRYAPSMLLPWTESEYLGQLRTIEDIVQKFQPDIVGIEWFLRAGQDVCKKLGLKFFVITPNSSKDLLGSRWTGFWKYPALSSGFAYPLPWSKIVPNVYINFKLIAGIKSSSTVKKADKMRKTYNRSELPILVDPRIRYFCPSTPDLDFPLDIPANVTLCGPLVMPTPPIEFADPSLTDWLNQAPTVLVNLGSHVTFDASAVRELVGGFRTLLKHHPTVQILWKLRPEGDIQRTLEECVDNDVVVRGRINVVHWLQSEPFAVLQHRNVICSVHHGGANSFFEAVSAGVPQIILPVWYDTYDYATRAEWLGIGLWGSHRSAPKAESSEFGHALLRVAGSSSEADGFRDKAKRLAESCQTRYTGRVLAADEVLKM